MISRLTCSLCLLVLSSFVVAESPDESVPDKQSLAGLWQGVGEGNLGPWRFDVELSLDGDSLKGVFIVIEEKGERMALEYVDFEDGILRITVMEGAVELKGRVKGDEIEGDLSLPGGEMSVQMARKDSSAAKAMFEDLERQVAELREKPLERIRSGPGMESIDEEALSRLLDAADASYTTGLALMHDGELVGEWFRGESPKPVHAMSVTKTALHLVIGRLITLGKLESVDVPVHQFYPQWADDEERAGITIRQLMAHTSGLDRGQPTGPIYQSDDFVQFALDAPLEAEPGTKEIYSNNGTNLLGGIVKKIIDRPIAEFLAEDLFGLLGIESFVWHPDPAGNPQGMAGLYLTAGDLARLGQLALDRGCWQGERLIDADWFEESFEPGEQTERIGLIWFLELDGDEVAGASHSGYLGQWLGLWFEEGIVGVRMVANSPAYNPETDIFRDFLQMLPVLVTKED